MSLLRFAARSLLASYFVASGVKAIRNPEPFVAAAEPLADRFVPMVKQYAPDQVAGFIPEDAATLVRVNGLAQVIGGVALATGKGRRLGATMLAASLIPSTIAKHPFWAAESREERATEKAAFLKNASLLGGVLLASVDTEGRPSLAYRAQKGGQALSRDTRKATKRLSTNAGDLAEEALAGGAALVTAVAASSRAAKQQAGKDWKSAKATARKQTAEALEAAQKAAKQAKKDGAKQLKLAKKEGVKQLKVAKKTAKKVGKNISLGEN